MLVQVERIWDGGRTVEAVAVAGEDDDDKVILRHVLAQVVEDVSELAEDPAHCAALREQQKVTQRALAEEDRTWRAAARLASLPPTAEAKSEAALLIAHVIQSVEPRVSGWQSLWPRSASNGGKE